MAAFARPAVKFSQSQLNQKFKSKSLKIWGLEACQGLYLQQDQATISKDLSQSTPNLAQKGDQRKGTSRLGYNQKALREIREGLRGLEISEGPATESAHNNHGFNGTDSRVDEDLVQKLMVMGYDQGCNLRVSATFGANSVMSIAIQRHLQTCCYLAYPQRSCKNLAGNYM
ncbi:hypothetical protein CAPTEDRAFT_203670 [Capitella teleta]|uniref:Uncharacterized protein n=1 Tax=Capitella teleta TaxID=283909 RepID=R7U5K0_CAPTE|nr:hypothetical protein CAPTEDRAFT_203670 [Capitella teleta]|eukprot:ELT98410.1 hypothetical protein CAPTEDRAFT_203670 [Capitella teleta]